MLLVVSVSMALGPAAAGLVAPVWLLIALCMLPGWLSWTPRVVVTETQVEIVNAFRTISVPLNHVIRLEPPADPFVVVTAYGEFTMGRLANGRDPGTNDEEVAAAISAVMSGRPGKAPGEVGRWRRRRFGFLDWVVALSAWAGALIQVWLIFTSA
jgi:hypothetical protein